MKLNQRQQDIVDRMKNGWELGSTLGGRSPTMHQLQLGGLGKGGESETINYNTIWALLRRKLIKSIYGFPTTRYVLTDNGGNDGDDDHCNRKRQADNS